MKRFASCAAFLWLSPRRAFLPWTSNPRLNLPTGCQSATDSTMSSLSLPFETNDNQTASNVIRVLALHGSGGTGESIERTLQRWNELLTQDDACRSESNSTLQITTVDGHEPKEEGFAWWYLPSGERSSTAEYYSGFEISRSTVLDALSSVDRPPFDVVMGHSQGAILIAALLALNAIPQHPRVGYILNGVAWPNPYTAELEALLLALPNDGTPVKPPRVLVLVGERDTINTPDQGYRVITALKKAGFDVTTLSHPGGHSIPTRHDETWDAIQAWLRQSGYR
jgi:predicted esterase